MIIEELCKHYLCQNRIYTPIQKINTLYRKGEGVNWKK